MKRSVRVAGAAILVALMGIATAIAQRKPLRVVPSVDLSRYAGTWYEIARLPNSFQKKCAGEVSAHYTLEANGKITVSNRCRLESGEYTEAKGVARLAGKGQPNSVLKVRFAPAFLSFLPQVWGDYQILSLSAEYSYALVGSPDREYLWILARSRRIDPATYDGLVGEAKEQGFDVSMLQKTRQTE